MWLYWGGMGTIHNKLAEKSWLKGFLLWHWHNMQSSVLNHIIGNQYTNCCTDTDRASLLSEVDEQFPLIKLIYYLPGVWLRAAQVGSPTRTQSESPGICPVTGTKTGMGSGVCVPLKLCLSRDMPPLWPVSLPSPPPTPLDGTVELCTWIERGNVNKLKCRTFTKADILPHTLTLNSL